MHRTKQVTQRVRLSKEELTKIEFSAFKAGVSAGERMCGAAYIKAKELAGDMDDHTPQPPKPKKAA